MHKPFTATQLRTHCANHHAVEEQIHLAAMDFALANDVHPANLYIKHWRYYGPTDTITVVMGQMSAGAAIEHAFTMPIPAIHPDKAYDAALDQRTLAEAKAKLTAKARQEATARHRRVQQYRRNPAHQNED